MFQVLPPTEEDRRHETLPMFFPTVGFIGGIAASQNFPERFWPWMVLTAVAVCGYFVYRKKTQIVFWCLIVLAMAAGGLHHYLGNYALPSHHIRNFVREDSDLRTPEVKLTAWVAGPATINQPEKTFPYHTQPRIRTRMLVEAEKIFFDGRTVPVTGQVEVTLPGMVDRFHPGQLLRITGQLASTKSTASDFPFPSNFSYYEDNLIFARMTLNSVKAISVRSEDQFRAEAVLARVRQVGQSLLLGHELPGGESERGLLNAVVLGNRYQVQNGLNEAFVNIGAAHMLAVSGFNLAILAGGIWGLCSLTGISRRATMITIIISSLMFTALTDFQPSIIRATIMVIILSLGGLLNKQPNALNSLAVAAVLILLLNPNQLFNPGFQLSFMATLGLILLSNPIYHFLFTPDIPTLINPQDSRQTSSFWITWNFGADMVRSAFAASLAAGIAALPLVMVHFHLLSLLGPVTTILLLIPVSILTLTGFAQMVIALLLPGPAALLGQFNTALCAGLSWLTLHLAKLPGVSFDVPPPSWFLILAYFFAVFYSVVKIPGSTIRFKWRSIPILLVIVIYLTGWPAGSATARPWVYLAGFSEGQTATVCSGGNLLLIDCGSPKTGQVGQLARSVACRFIATPSAVVLTCPDQEFFNDLWSLTAGNPQVNVFVPFSFNSSLARQYQPVDIFLSDSTLHREKISAGTRIGINETQISVLYSPADLSGGGAVLLIPLETRNVVVGSIITPQACRMICTTYPRLRADTLVINGSSDTSPGLEGLIAHLQPRRLALTGRPTFNKTLWYQAAAKKLQFQFIPVARQGGLLIEDK
jgi:competence protein ComEC